MSSHLQCARVVSLVVFVVYLALSHCGSVEVLTCFRLKEASRQYRSIAKACSLELELLLCKFFHQTCHLSVKLSQFLTRKKRTKEEGGRLHQGVDRPGVWQVPEGSGEQGKMEKTGCKIICGAPTTLVVKELMMMMNFSPVFSLYWSFARVCSLALHFSLR